MVDVERFVVWLGENEVPAAHLPLYRELANQLVAVANGPVLPKHVDQIVRERDAAGAPARELANLHKVGNALVRFQDEHPAQVVPSASAAPPPPSAKTVSSEPPAPKRKSVSRGLLGLFMIATVGVVGQKAGRGCVAKLFEKGSEPVTGAFHSPHLNVDLTFPAGWRHIKDDDGRDTAMGVDIASSSFFHGGSPEHPEVFLAVMSSGSTDVLGAIDDNRLMQMAQGGADGGCKGVVGKGGTCSLGNCERYRWHGHAARCTGHGATSDHENFDLAFYAFIDDHRFAMVFAGITTSDATARTDIEDIVSSLQL